MAPHAVQLSPSAAARYERSALARPRDAGEIVVVRQVASVCLGDRRQSRRVEDRDFRRIGEADRRAPTGGIDRYAVRALSRQRAAFGGQPEIRPIAAYLSVVAARDQ